MKLNLLHRLILVRHGESHGNLTGFFLGLRDPVLTEKGLAQVNRTAVFLKNRKIAGLYTSPLVRARQTAKAVGEALALEPLVEPRLIEQDYGKWDGLALGSIKAEYREDFKRWLSGDPVIAPSGGESLLQMSERVRSFSQELRKKFRTGESLVLVGHAGALQALICHCLGTPLSNKWPYRLAAGSISELWVYQDCASLDLLSFRPASK